jgi:hypothetical protein
MNSGHSRTSNRPSSGSIQAHGSRLGIIDPIARPEAPTLPDICSITAEQYRQLFGVDAEFIAADRIRDESGCVLRYERTFMRPLLTP